MITYLPAQFLHRIASTVFYCSLSILSYPIGNQSINQSINRHYFKMMSDNSMPVMNQPANMMESGPNGNNLAAAAVQRHPVESLQAQQGVYCRTQDDGSASRVIQDN
jgi:hypothetical protein